MIYRKLWSRIIVSILASIPLYAATASSGETIISADDSPLSVIDAGVAPRFTNVPTNHVLYPGFYVPQACCIHPYDPDFHAFPVVVSFTNSMLGAIPAAVLAQVPDAHRSSAKLFINVQDTPWPDSTPALVRAHALFPSMGNRTAGIKVLNDSGSLLLDTSGSVHSHDAVASPNNFPIPGLDINRVNALWSVVTHGAETFVTRHTLLPAAQHFQLENFLFDRVQDDGEPEVVVPKIKFVGTLTPRFFAPLLSTDYLNFLGTLGVTTS